MAVQVLQDCKLLVAGYDLSGKMNALALDYSADMVDDTTFGDTTRSRLGGLKNVTAQHNGYWDGTGLDDILFNRIGLAGEVMTIAPAALTAGNRAFTFKSTLGEYAPGGAVGDMFAFSVSGESSDSLVRGTVLFNNTVTATGSGAGQNLGAVSSTQKLYAALHVLAASGTSLTVRVQSDVDNTFASPVNQITFAAATAIGAQWATPVNGAITDTFWRVDYTVVGGSPSFQFVVIIGIQ